jgi:hypothetical protein
LALGGIQVWPLLDILGVIAFPILLGLTYIGPGAYFAVRIPSVLLRGAHPFPAFVTVA